MQPVDEDAYEAVTSLGRKGGWETLVSKTKKAAKGKRKTSERESDTEPRVEGSGQEEGEKTSKMGGKQGNMGRKRKPRTAVDEEVSQSVVVADDTKSRKATTRSPGANIKADGDHVQSARRSSKRTKT